MPLASVAVAVTLYSPSANGLGTSALKLPEPSTVAVNVCVLPSASVTDSVTVLPAGKSVVPEIVGVVSLSSPSGSRVKLGALLSTVPVCDVEALFPAASVAVASTV